MNLCGVGGTSDTVRGRRIYDIILLLTRIVPNVLDMQRVVLLSSFLPHQLANKTKGK